MVNVKPVQLGKNVRMSFARINEVLQMPNLIEVQINSYKWFLEEGLKEVFGDVSAIYGLHWKPGAGLRGLPSGRNPQVHRWKSARNGT